MKYNFSKVKLTNIDGQEAAKDVHKTLAAVLYNLTSDLDLVEKALKINKGEEVELDKTEIAEVKKVINDPKAGFFAFVKKGLFDYIDSVKEDTK